MKLADLCTKPVRSIPAHADLHEAEDLLKRFGDECLLVCRGEEISGLLRRHCVDKARRFSLPLCAGDLANPDLPLVKAEEEAPPEKLALLLRNPMQRALVLEKGKPVGLVSAQTLLFSGLALPRHPSLMEAVPKPLRELLAWFYLASQELGVETYLVGGAVRDLILGRLPHDLDFVVAGDPQLLGKKLEEELGARRCKRSLFDTLKFTWGDYEIDLARARWEEYEAPAALPQVVPGNVFEDLFRRDFTVNAIALALSRPHFGRLIDFFGGLKDVAAGKIRIHHPLSFVDDPTRIFRAARYAVRFGWDLSPATRKALSLALRLGVAKLLSPARLRNEWLRLLEEEDPRAVIEWLRGEGLLGHLFSQPAGPETLERLFKLRDTLEKEALLEALALLLARREEAPFCGLAEDRFSSLLEEREKLLRRREFLVSRAPTSEKVFFLERLPVQVLVAEAASDPALFPLIERALRELFAVRPSLSGKKLRQAGIPPGPKLGEMLKRLRAARLDGLVRNEAEEWSFLKKEFADVFSA